MNRSAIIAALELIEEACRRLRCAIADDAAPANGFDVEESLRRICIEDGLRILPGDLVREQQAARLLDRAPRTLQNWRQQKDEALPWVVHMGKPAYRLRDLAEFIRKN